LIPVQDELNAQRLPELGDDTVHGWQHEPAADNAVNNWKQSLRQRGYVHETWTGQCGTQERTQMMHFFSHRSRINHLVSEEIQSENG
jgi:hypothetical protein